jgi:hypothetical protein
MPHVKNAELVEGIVYMPSPVRLVGHGKPHAILLGWLTHYVAKTPGLDYFGDNATVRLDEDNEPQPDVLLMLPAYAGGQARVDHEGYVNGAPEFVGEVAASSVSIDLHLKLNAYRRRGVREYLVWRTDDAEVDFFVVRDGQFDRAVPNSEGFLVSQVFPGLWLDPGALVRGDLPRLFEVVDRGATTPEHKAFVERLKKSST